MEAIFFILMIASAFWMQAVRGQSTSTDGCYQVWPNSKVNCMNSYDHRMVANEQQCRDLCTQSNPQCQSVQYTSGTQQCDLYNVFIPVGASGRRKRETEFLDIVRSKRGGSYRPTYAGGGGGGGVYPAPAPAPAQYRPPQTYPAPAPAPAQYKPPQTYPAPAPAPAQYRPPQTSYPAPAPKPSYGGGGGATYGGGGSACGGYGPTVQGVGGYTYCKPTGTCMGAQTTPPPSPPPPQQPCPAGQVLRYYLATGFKLQGAPESTFTTDSEQACITACTNNQQPAGTAAMCKSADYNTQTKQCLVYASQSFPPNGTGAPQGDPNFKHYEKVCVDAALGNRCPGPFFLGPQMILIGYAQSVTTASSQDDCLNLCANAQSRFGFNCLSGMFYFQETSNNCILNSESRSTHPDLYNPENQDKVDYFEPGCTPGRFARQTLRDVRNRNVLQRDQPDFGAWTMCDKMVLGHKRFKQCSTLNPNKCTKDDNVCDPKKEDEYDLQIVHPVKPSNGGGSGSSSSGGKNQTIVITNNGQEETTVTETKTIHEETAFQQVHARDSGHDTHGPALPGGRCFPLVNLDGTKDCNHGTIFTTDGKRKNCLPTKKECS